MLYVKEGKSSVIRGSRSGIQETPAGIKSQDSEKQTSSQGSSIA